MSYRSIKRMLGETSLERKCRLLFGSGLLLLITGSFYIYARQTTDLVFRQNQTTARLLVAPIVMEKHWKWSDSGNIGTDNVERMAAELKPEELKDYSWTLLNAELSNPSARPLDGEGHIALEAIRGGESEVIKVIRDRSRQQYIYYGGVYATDSCLDCHRQHNKNPRLRAGDLIGMVKISFPLEKTQRSLAWNNAILLTTAIVTAFLAMLAAYAIVRYVIVKPVLHLKDVSDAIARGSLDMRADIRTGDEFEELSHAFNRMLRHLVTVQEELQHVNHDLDGKVDELAQVNLRLFELNKIKNEFLATMSHELRTPLNSILGFSEVLLSTSTLPDKQRRYVSNIQTAGKNLLNLINDVLDLAKIESGRMELHPSDFSIYDLVERQVGSLMPLAEKKHLELTSEVSPEVPLLWQDAGKLQQILGNLLSNAIKFTPDGGKVRVKVDLCPAERSPEEQTETIEAGDAPPVLDHFALIVEDTGIGIPLEEQERVFEKFRQGQSTPGQKDLLTREYEGTGLGLSIVRELSRLMGGEVRLQSEFGKGSVFTVVLPLKLKAQSESETILPLPKLESNSKLMLKLTR
ncbi:ATP-binding region ATPase domain protein [Planctopirus limnophila DSM 3776]|uniref:histidine kinase n=1 Tax=Planctopirus limnophila (strain ATCC 43296 / DSM 3776 / IFAM 1008 / Mu 290) TaxID=521674 RepID=D5STK2_PLAL2|nr:ATP-binding protein [Planctopirus limnophila]ADG69031.1 ATP-binding region ATPase domain protein [Planctopirus limnophila DSM 3776]